jgi:hypothetical protein
MWTIRKAKTTTSAVLMLLLAGCGGGLAGTYSGSGGTAFTFRDDGTVEVSGREVPDRALIYDVESDNIRIRYANNEKGAAWRTLTRKDADTLVGSNGVVYRRQ